MWNSDCFQVAYQGLCGDAEQRWFDKSVCMAFLKNGTVASNLDVSRCCHFPFNSFIRYCNYQFCVTCYKKRKILGYLSRLMTAESSNRPQKNKCILSSEQVAHFVKFRSDVFSIHLLKG